MVTDQVTIRQALYKGLDQTCIGVILWLAVSWIFSAFSYYISKATGEDWFTRSGAIMALVGAVATFQLVSYLYKAVAIALEEKLGPGERAIELILKPPPLHQQLSYISYMTGIVGTAIWGYGDLLL
jgi:hypothetical protein